MNNLLLYGLLGLIGQSIRVIIGLSKLKQEADARSQESKVKAANDSNVAPKTPQAIYNGLFDGSQLGLSLLIGFVAGCLASFTRDENAPINREVQLAIIAAGYAGTDFIEGAFKKVLPAS
jgi:hypothetical protein